jgi:hypothetical protein
MTKSAITVAVHPLRQRRDREFLRRQTLPTVTSPDEVDDEGPRLPATLPCELMH